MTALLLWLEETLPRFFESIPLGINDLKHGLDALNQKVHAMSHTLDEVLANEKSLLTAIQSLPALLQAKLATVPGLTADQQAQIDAIFAAQTTNASEIAAEVAALTPAGVVAPSTPAA